jgi:transposase
MDEESIRARVVAAGEQGSGALVTLVATLVAEAVATLTARVSVLEAENAALRAKLAVNSHNSSKPPSSDGLGMRPHPKSLRQRSGRPSGGQAGHEGHTLSLVDTPDAVQVHAPPRCAQCGTSLEGVTAVRQERRQVVDIEITRSVTEHQAQTKCCPRCGAETVGEFPATVRAPVQSGPGVKALAVYLNQEQLVPSERTCAVLAEVCDCPLSEATLEHAVAECYEHLAPVEAAIKEGVTRAAVAHFDETGVDLNGKTGWLHVACTTLLTYYAIHAKRGRVAMEAVGILTHFLGRAMHDGLTSYQYFGQCLHALCNAHHLRELTFVEEQLGQHWAGDLKQLLGEMKHAADAAARAGLAAVPDPAWHDFLRRYEALLALGVAANPLPPPTGKRGRRAKGKARCLVDRLQLHKEDVLAFLTDVTIPFDNNQAERDIRMTKVRQKISGCFRSDQGATHFCRIRGYVSTLRKQGLPIFASLSQAISGTPVMPATTPQHCRGSVPPALPATSAAALAAGARLWLMQACSASTTCGMLRHAPDLHAGAG